MAEGSRYEQRGVSAVKEEVHRAISKLDKGIFPNAFCKILPDIAGDPEYCSILHNDGSGSKAALAFLVWKETGNLNAWRGIIRDSLFMNLDDLSCVGALGPFHISLAINRNKALIPGEVIEVLIDDCQTVCDEMFALGIPCTFAGGDTADVGDQVRTITVDNSVTARMKRSEVIDAGRIAAGAIIVGFSSTGTAKWESEPNSGIGSNGLTNARHESLTHGYAGYKETYAPETDLHLVYCGEHSIDDLLPGDHQFSVGSALLSPTRTYVPLVKRILEEMHRSQILAFIHCSGGGQTKIGGFGPRGILYKKDNLFRIPPLFAFLQKVRNLPLREMLQSYNMGHRFEIVVNSESVAAQCIRIGQYMGIDSQRVGVVKKNPDPTKRTLLIQTPDGEESYES